jgi:hypothetical protein
MVAGVGLRGFELFALVGRRDVVGCGWVVPIRRLRCARGIDSNRARRHSMATPPGIVAGEVEDMIRNTLRLGFGSVEMLTKLLEASPPNSVITVKAIAMRDLLESYDALESEVAALKFKLKTAEAANTKKD